MLMKTRNKTTSHAISRASSNPPSGQSGAVLLIALVVLIAMTLSALSLIRSVNTTNLIAGNLSFHESALLFAERSTEIALNDYLSPNCDIGNSTLYTSSRDHGYRAVRADPAAGQNWETFWEDTLEAQSKVGDTDASSGNKVSYVIHRLCDKEGDPRKEETKCSKPPVDTSDSSRDGGKDPLATPSQVYYRITSRVAGPRNTVVYTQTVVAL
jgi:Tfp pilus assembly protein PilX